MAALDSPRPHDALAARVAAAAQALPPDQRRALTLRERDGANYHTIGDALGIEVAEVSELLVAGRLAVREAVRHAGPPPLRSPYCADARRLLALRQDGEYLSPGEIDWLRQHVEACDGCRLARRALREASLACRAWGQTPMALAPPAVQATVAEPEAPDAAADEDAAPADDAAAAASEAVDAPADDGAAPADAGSEAAALPSDDGAAGAPAEPGSADTPPDDDTPGAAATGEAPADETAVHPEPARRGRRRRTRRLLGMVSAGAPAAAIAIVAVSAIGREEPSQASDRLVATPAGATPAATATQDTAAAERRRRAERAKARDEAAAERRRKDAAAGASATEAPPAPAPTSAPAPTVVPVSTTAPQRQQPAATPKPKPKPIATATPQPTATPAPATTPAGTPKPDVVPEDGDQFCFEGDPGCDQ